MNVIYDDVRSPGSFGGIRNLKRYSSRSEHEVKTFLAGRDTYTLHKPRRIRFPRRKTYSKGIADLYQIDLADMSNISSYNDGVRYLLTCIDVFSKKAWAVPVRTKTGREVTNAFEKILLDGTPNMVSSLSTLPFHLCCEADPLNPARGSGERCKLPQRGLGQSPGRNRI